MKNLSRFLSLVNPTLFIAFCSIGLAASSADAEPIFGKLRNNGPGQALELILVKTSQPVAIEARSEIMNYLRNLSTGDSISGNGRITNDKKRVIIESLDRIGLQELLGAWRSSSREIFEFQTYDKLNVYVPTVQPDGAISFSQTRALQYVLTPEKGNGFSIFMADHKGNVRLAFITLENRKLEMTLTDFETGQLKEKFSLSPFYMR